MSELLKSAKRNFAKKHEEYGLVTCVDERAYTCGFVEGVIHCNDIFALQIEMLQSKVRELEKEKQPDYPTLNRQS